MTVRIFINPGHGGKDSGAVNHNLNLKEKDIALRLANALSVNLQKKKLSNNEEIKESLKEEIQKIKNDINTLNMHYIKDMNLIKLAVAQTQNHYNTTHKQLNDKITHLELQIEKINSIWALLA